MSAHYKSLARRTNPENVSLFPLNGTVLLPGCDLPLNIFEPRYLFQKRMMGVIWSC